MKPGRSFIVPARRQSDGAARSDGLASGLQIIVRPPKVGPLLGLLSQTYDDSGLIGHSQRVFFTIETNFLDSPSRALVAVREVGTTRWQIYHGLPSITDLPGEYRPQLCAHEAPAPLNPLVTYFTVDVPVGRTGRWELVCLSLSLTVPGTAECSLDDDVNACSPADVATLLDTLAGEALDPPHLQAPGELRHGYIDRRRHRKAVLDLAQCGAGADHAAVDTAVQEFMFAVGSCRYPGTELDRPRCDRILNLINAARPAFTLIVGDAIYADAAVDVATQRAEQERWVDRYERAFTSAGFASLLAASPTYFLPDDHEFANDWAALPDLGRQNLRSHEQLARSRRDSFAWAFDAFTVFEWWHGPRAGASSAQRTSRGRAVLASASGAKPPEWPATFNWSATRFGGQPFFLMDTRTERTRGWPGATDRLISGAQMQALIDWLIDHRRHSGYKFVVSASPIAPAPKAVIGDADAGLFDDGWWGYPEQMREVLAVIAHHQIERVVFIGGDSHLGATGRLLLRFQSGADDHAVEVAWVVSSGLFIPLPGVNGRPTDYPPDENSRGGRPNPMPYRPACGPVNSAYSAIDGGQLTCELRILCFHFAEHAVTIRVPKSAPGATTLPWPQVDFLL